MTEVLLDSKSVLNRLRLGENVDFGEYPHLLRVFECTEGYIVFEKIG